MSPIADQMRDRRRAWAAPGGFHDRMVRFLARSLPAGVGAIVAAMMITPLFPRSEVSFLLDRTKVAITEDRLSVDQASYRGENTDGRTFQVDAGHASQHSARVPVVNMRDLTAQMQLKDGTARMTTATGQYHLDSDHVVAPGAVRVTTTTGMQLDSNSVDVDLKRRVAVGEGGVHGAMRAGTFSAQRMTADLDARTVTLDGRAQLHMMPARMRTTPHK